MTDNVNIEKFPLYFKEKLLNGELSFPDNIRFEYSPKRAYRAVIRGIDDYRAVNNDDFIPYIKKNQRPRGADINYKPGVEDYAASVFTNINDIKAIFKFPNPRKKLACGHVRQEGGPISQKGTHINWWIYETYEIVDFVLLKDDEVL